MLVLDEYLSTNKVKRMECARGYQWGTRSRSKIKLFGKLPLHRGGLIHIRDFPRHHIADGDDMATRSKMINGPVGGSYSMPEMSTERV